MHCTGMAMLHCAGVSFLKAKVDGVEHGGGSSTLKLADGTTIKGSLVLDATGHQRKLVSMVKTMWTLVAMLACMACVMACRPALLQLWHVQHAKQAPGREQQGQGAFNHPGLMAWVPVQSSIQCTWTSPSQICMPYVVLVQQARASCIHASCIPHTPCRSSLTRTLTRGTRARMASSQVGWRKPDRAGGFMHGICRARAYA